MHITLNLAVNLFLLAAPADTECRQEYKTALQNYVVGRYVPRCRPDGSYEPLQCHTSVCFCVDKNGNEIPGSRKSAYSPPNCIKFGTFVVTSVGFLTVKSRGGNINRVALRLYYCSNLFWFLFWFSRTIRFKMAFCLLWVILNKEFNIKVDIMKTPLKLLG